MANPSAKSLADEARWAAFREAVAKMTRRQRGGLRLYLLRQQAKQGDQQAAKQAETLAAKLRCADAIDAHAAELRNQDHGLTLDQARYLAETAFNTNKTDNDE